MIHILMIPNEKPWWPIDQYGIVHEIVPNNITMSNNFCTNKWWFKHYFDISWSWFDRIRMDHTWSCHRVRPPHVSSHFLVILMRKTDNHPWELGYIPYVKIFQNPFGGFLPWSTPNGWFLMENPIKMDDLGVPPFQETHFIESTTLFGSERVGCSWLL